MPTKRCPNGSVKNKKTGLCESKKAKTVKNKRSSPKTENDCPICLEPLDAKAKEADLKPYKTKCKHVFHRGCLKNQCAVKQNCPNCRADIKEDCSILHGKNTLSISEGQIEGLITEKTNLEKPQQDFYWLKDKIKKTKLKPHYKYLSDHIPGGVHTINAQIMDMLERQYSHNEKPFGSSPHKTLNEAEIQDILQGLNILLDVLDRDLLTENSEKWKWFEEKLRKLKYDAKYKYKNNLYARSKNVYGQANDMVQRQYLHNQPVLGRYSPA